MYTWHLNLTIRHLTKADFGAYSCSSVNALGKSEARIRLQGMYVLLLTLLPHHPSPPLQTKHHPTQNNFSSRYKHSQTNSHILYVAISNLVFLYFFKLRKAFN